MSDRLKNASTTASEKPLKRISFKINLMLKNHYEYQLFSLPSQTFSFIPVRFFSDFVLHLSSLPLFNFCYLFDIFRLFCFFLLTGSALLQYGGPLRGSSSLLLSEKFPQVPGRDSNSGPAVRQAVALITQVRHISDFSVSLNLLFCTLPNPLFMCSCIVHFLHLFKYTFL